MEAANRAAAWQMLTVTSATEVSNCLTGLIDSLTPHGFSERDLFGIRLALEEALVNAVKHGNQNDPQKSVRIRYQVDPHQFLVEVHDEGPGFNPEQLPDPLSPENLERPGGRGVFLMRNYMTSVTFNDRGNCVTMCRRRTA